MAREVNLLAGLTRLAALTGLTGRWIPGNEDEDVAESTSTQAVFSEAVPLSVAHPGASLRLPIDEDLGADIEEVVAFPFGIQFAFAG